MSPILLLYEIYVLAPRQKKAQRLILTVMLHMKLKSVCDNAGVVVFKIQVEENAT